MTSEAPFRPTQPQSIGEVLDTSFRLYRASFGKVWPLCLLLALAASPTAVYMLKYPMPQPTAENPMAALAMFQDPTYWLMYLIGMALMLCVMGALYLRQNAIGSGEELTNGTALQLALRKVLPIFVMSILFFIAIAVGSVLLIVPGVILSLSLSMSFAIALIEDRGPLNSLIASHRMVWGNWWRTAAIMTVALIIVMVLYVALGFVAGVVGPLFMTQSNAAMYGFVIGQLISISANVVVTPYFIALLVAVYWDLKLRKQGDDLAARVGALGTA